MRVAYFDCFSGISGDMALGALLHAGVDEAAWRAELAKLNVPGYELRVEPVVKEGISAIDVDVVLHEADQGHGRHLADIAEILNRSGLSDTVRRRVPRTGAAGRREGLRLAAAPQSRLGGVHARHHAGARSGHAGTVGRFPLPS